MGKALTREEVIKRLNNNFLQKVELISEYKNKRTPIILRCLECGYKWEANPGTVLYNDKRGPNHHCPNCGNKHRVKVKCAWCGQEIERTQSQIEKNKTGFFYCCKEHGNLHKNLLRYENGEWDNSSNYRLKAFNKYEHKCNCCGWDEDERILEVHHIDENRDNNELDNLIILCPTCHRKITLGYYFLDKENNIHRKEQVQILLSRPARKRNLIVKGGINNEVFQ